MDITILNSFGVLYRKFMKDTDELLNGTDISFSECTFLVNIGFSEGTNQEKIANKLMIDRAAIARSVKSLAAKGYVRTERSTDDMRSKELYLTDSGIQILTKVTKFYLEQIRYLTDGIDPGQWQVFLSVLETVTEKALKK